MFANLRQGLQLIHRSCVLLRSADTEFLSIALRGLGGAAIHRTSKDVLQATVIQYPFAVQYFEHRELPVLNSTKELVSKCTLPGEVFNVPVRVDILHRVVRWQRAQRQQGTHKTKNRAEVSGGGKKPWRQKGSGRARQGSIRAPQWRHGGVVFGPVPRSHAHDLPKKVRRLGLKCALSAKANEGRLMIVDSLKPELPKTKILHKTLLGLLESPQRLSVLLVDDDHTTDDGIALRRAAANIPGVEVVPQIGLNVYSLLTRDTVIITRAALDHLVERIQAPINRLGSCRQNRLALVQAAKQTALKQAAETGNRPVDSSGSPAPNCSGNQPV